MSEITEACVFDMCAFENDPKQNEVRCQAYEELNAKCLELADNMNLNASWVFDWRKPTNCCNIKSTHCLIYLIENVIL